MREPLRDKERLQHMIEAIDRIMRYTANKSYQDLVNDDMMYYAVVKNIEIIGEAANMLTAEFHDAHPETPWDNIEKMRHVLVHDYYQIDENEVRYVIEDDLRPLKEQIIRYISETDWDKWE